MTAARTDEAALTQDVTDGTRGWPDPVGLAPSQDHEKFPRPPTRMAPAYRHDHIDDRRRYPMRMRPRRTRSIHQSADPAVFIALDHLVAGLATDTRPLAQRLEVVLLLKVAGNGPRFVKQTRTAW
jgi:hypothetical protein